MIPTGNSKASGQANSEWTFLKCFFLHEICEFATSHDNKEDLIRSLPPLKRTLPFYHYASVTVSDLPTSKRS